MKLVAKLWIGIFILALLAPLGLIIPELFKAGSAWGEWGREDLIKMVGYFPRGMQRIAEIWKAPLPDYAFRGSENKGLQSLSLGYIVSGLIGILAVALAIYLLAKFLTKHVPKTDNKKESSRDPEITLKRRSGRNKFVEYSLIRTLEFFRNEIFAESFSSANGLMQKIQPRIKLIGLILILIIVSLLKDIRLIFALYILSIALAYLSRISVLYFLKRTWIFIPLFSLFIAVPALFNIFSPGEVIFFGITKQGLSSASLFILRVLTSVSFSVLIVLTTTHTRLLKAMRSLGVPQVFVMTFMMCYRYIFIFIKIAQEMYFAIKSRLIGSVKNRKAHHVVAWHIGVLWEKSRLMSEEVYMAMISRGYSGEPKTINGKDI